jgi:enamine deaminase RidA (YjgF/YER057c/UK114 family)
MNEHEKRAGLPLTDRYRYADVVGDRLYVAGQVPLNAEGRVAAGVRTQARQCLDNLELLVFVHGFTRKDVHQVRVYVAGDHTLLLEAWEAVAEWFESEVPPATLLGVAGLGHSGQLVEIDAWVERADS